MDKYGHFQVNNIESNFILVNINLAELILLQMLNDTKAFHARIGMRSCISKN